MVDKFMSFPPTASIPLPDRLDMWVGSSDDKVYTSQRCGILWWGWLWPGPSHQLWPLPRARLACLPFPPWNWGLASYPKPGTLPLSAELFNNFHSISFQWFLGRNKIKDGFPPFLSQPQSPNWDYAYSITI